MQNIRSKNTSPERIFFYALSQQNLSFARHCLELPGKPDIVFHNERVAIFIDSDFWHGHPTRFRAPTTNEDYWRAKIVRNKTRDAQVSETLRNDGWLVLRFWAHDIKTSLDACVLAVVAALEGIS